MPIASPESSVRIGVALVALHVIWGSTYLAIRVAVETIPPLRVVLHNRRDLERFAVERLAPLPGIGRIQTSLVLREVKRITALPVSPTPGTA